MTACQRGKDLADPALESKKFCDTHKTIFQSVAVGGSLVSELTNFAEQLEFSSNKALLVT